MIVAGAIIIACTTLKSIKGKEIKTTLEAVDTGGLFINLLM